jgi:hypothetical protein
LITIFNRAEPIIKKRWILLGALGLAILGVILLCLLWPIGVSLVNYCFIEEGMTADDVEAMFGSPAKGPESRQGLPKKFANQGWLERWRGREVDIVIYYDVDGRVLAKEWFYRWPSFDLQVDQ